MILKPVPVRPAAIPTWPGYPVVSIGMKAKFFGDWGFGDSNGCLWKKPLINQIISAFGIYRAVLIIMKKKIIVNVMILKDYKGKNN